MTRNEFVESIKIGHTLGNALECMEPMRRSDTSYNIKMEIFREITDDNGFHDFRIDAHYPGGVWETYYSFEELWGNAPITQELLQQLKSLGVQAVRLPINMTGHFLDGVIDPLWLKNIKTIVGWAIDTGLKCILSVHSDYRIMNRSGNYLSLIYPDIFTPEQDGVGRFIDAWKQLAEYMNEFSVDDLAFELANNFQIVDVEKQTTREQLVEYSMRLYRKLYTVIREVGGNAAKRFLLIGGYHNDIWYNPEIVIDMIRSEFDDWCILSTSFHAPHNLTINTISDAWDYDATTKEQLDAQFEKLLKVRESTDMPIVVAEYGIGDIYGDGNNAISREYCYFMTNMMKWLYDNNFSSFIWDAGHIIHRDTLEYGIPFWENIVEAVRLGTDHDISADVAVIIQSLDNKEDIDT